MEKVAKVSESKLSICNVMIRVRWAYEIATRCLGVELSAIVRSFVTTFRVSQSLPFAVLLVVVVSSVSVV